MYTVYLINFGYSLHDVHSTLEAALAKAKSTAFECSIYQGETLVASWSIFGGTRYYYADDSDHNVVQQLKTKYHAT